MNANEIGNALVVWCPDCGKACIYGTTVKAQGWEDVDLCIEHGCAPDEWLSTNPNANHVPDFNHFR